MPMKGSNQRNSMESKEIEWNEMEWRIYGIEWMVWTVCMICLSMSNLLIGYGVDDC